MICAILSLILLIGGLAADEPRWVVASGLFAIASCM